ncbi:hypothetical protein BDR05DRAFT_100410 [Suillus weaverae]|nr:hypothetical protein BDR05DRAFT_100410 [Suillus weaverae]
MEPHQGHRMNLFSKPRNNQPDNSNSQKPLFMTPQPGHTDKRSAASAFSNSSQRTFTPTRSSNLVENAASRNLADSSLHLPSFKFNMTTSRLESHSPSSQHSSSFYDTNGRFSARRPNVEMKKEDHGDYMRLICYHLMSFFQISMDTSSLRCSESSLLNIFLQNIDVPRPQKRSVLDQV